MLKSLSSPKTRPCQIPCSVFATLSVGNSRALMIGMMEAASIRPLLGLAPWVEQFSNFVVTIASSCYSLRTRICAYEGLGIRANAQQTNSVISQTQFFITLSNQRV